MGHLRGAVADDAHDAEDEIEVPEPRRSSESDANAHPKTARHGTMIRRGPTRSKSQPSGGETTATVIAAMPNAADTASRDHENVSASGFRNTPNV